MSHNNYGEVIRSKILLSTEKVLETVKCQKALPVLPPPSTSSSHPFPKRKGGSNSLRMSKLLDATRKTTVKENVHDTIVTKETLQVLLHDLKHEE
jgi:hypothetical protein